MSPRSIPYVIAIGCILAVAVALFPLATQWRNPGGLSQFWGVPFLLTLSGCIVTIRAMIIFSKEHRTSSLVFACILVFQVFYVSLLAVFWYVGVTASGHM